MLFLPWYTQPMGLKKRRNTRIGNWCGGNSAGFTLIEVLIATLVLSMVIYLATISYAVFLDTWERKRLLDVVAIQEYRSRFLLRNSLESIFDYYVTDPKSERINRRFPFFKGEKERLEFVTLSSVFHKGKPAVARIRLQKNEANDSKALIYEEASLEQRYIRYNDDSLEYEIGMPICENLKSLHIRYFGVWETKFDLLKDAFVTEYKWQETFEGKKRNATPDIIEIKVGFGAGETNLVFPVMAHSPGKGYFFNSER